jgi:phosphoenolpyruvate phosphomutase|tara:strand:- start:228 stop:656 length:429 start_codon:yes stop_codon:yes gene_type:complete
MKKKIAYVGMSADIIHPGHINILKIAAKKGSVIVGLLTDSAINSYKGKTYMNYYQREKVLMAIKYVKKVIPQKSLDYSENLIKLKPDFVVHAKDWKKGVQASTRKKVIKTIKEWSGKLIEPNYTKGVSSSKLKKKILWKSKI